MASDGNEGKQPLLILYGSETGNAESLSKRIHQDAIAVGYHSEWAPMKDFKKYGLDKLESWPKYPIIFVSSSTGDGDPPENAETFWRQLRRKANGDGKALDTVRFIILGLGDSNYDSYQGFPLALYAKLTQLGAKPIIPVGKADEATGALEDFIEPWIAELWVDLESHLKTGAVVEVTLAPTLQEAPKPASTAAAPAPTAPTPAPTPVPTPAVPITVEAPVAIPAATPAPMPSSTAASTPAATPAPTPVGTPSVAGAGGVKVARGAIVPKAPNHVCKLEFVDSASSVTAAPRFPLSTGPVSKENPTMARVVSHRILSSPDAVREIWEVTMKMRLGQILPGDAIGVWPQNCPILTQRLLEALNIEDPDRLFTLTPLTADPKAIIPKHINFPTSLRSAFLNSVNINGIVSKRLLVMLAGYCSSQASKDALMEIVNDKTRFKIDIEDSYATILDILERYPDCKPDLGHLLDSLSPLMPRYYSIANFDHTAAASNGANGSTDAQQPESTFRFVFSIERTTLSNKTFFGVASNWLKYGIESNPSMEVPVFARPHSEFVLPTDQSLPIIMCSAGTGIAPFMGFLEQRRHIKETSPDTVVGPALLFTGHRHPKMDWIYAKEIKEALLEGDRVLTAFSRFHPGNVEYIQHLVAQPENAKQILDLMLNQDAIWYICGDARTMATNLRETTFKILQEHIPGMDTKEASNKLLEWSKGKRCRLDIWG